MAHERLGAGFQAGDPVRLEQAGGRGVVRGSGCVLRAVLADFLPGWMGSQKEESG